MVIEHIDAQIPGAILDRHDFRGDQTIVVAKETLLALVDLLHGEGFQFLVDITAVDWSARKVIEVVLQALVAAVMPPTVTAPDVPRPEPEMASVVPTGPLAGARGW